MTSPKVQETLVPPPSLMKSLMAGFDAVSKHVTVILFAISLDIWLWLGPRLRLYELFQQAFSQTENLFETQSPEMMEAFEQGLQAFNLFGTLRTFPVGPPSLMVGHTPMQIPSGFPQFWELPSLTVSLVVWLALTLLGVFLGTLYFISVSQAALVDRVNWRQAFTEWPRAFMHMSLLTLGWFILVLMIFLPFSCLFSVLILSGLGISQLLFFVALAIGGLLIWLLVPLVFSPHGIVVNKWPAWVSLLQSIRLTRMTFQSTGLFLLVIVVLSEGLNILWSVPATTSWLTLVGIAGHAFISAALLAASFIYYRDAGLWVQSRLQSTRLSVA
jgi:hypothetical protein